MGSTASDRSLHGIGALASLGPVARDDLSRSAGWHTYTRGQLVIDQHDLSTDVFFIATGSVRATIYSSTGKEVTFRDMSAGDMFGELAAIDGSSRSAAIIALTDCVVASLPADRFWKLLHENPDFAAATLKQLAKMVRTLSERVFEVSALNVRNRVHIEFLRLARAHPLDENSAAISPAPTHVEIANRIGTHREAVTREIGELTKSGLIKRQDNTFFVTNVARLARMVEKVLGQAI